MCMATMVTDTALKGRIFAFIPLLFIAPSTAGEFTLEPGLSVSETYSDNILATRDNKESSYVTDASFVLGTSFRSRKLDFGLESRSSYLMYTHDHDLDKTYHAVQSTLNIKPITSGPIIFASVNIANQSRNNADNLYSDLISGNTIQTEQYQAGIRQEIDNSRFVLSAEIAAFDVRSEDNVGENHGYTSSLSFSNGDGIRSIFWDINGSYYDRSNEDLSGRNYNIEAKVGFNTAWKISPFVRYYDEDYSGNVAVPNRDTTASKGAGLRWQITDHMLLDVSYNYVDDDRISDDYLETSFDWQASERTSIFAGYSQRFYGDSYNLKISHKNRRMTNTISYDESLQAFTRDNFITEIVDNVFCPIGQPINLDNCLDNLDNIDDPSQYGQVNVFGQTPVEDDQFSLYKRLSWNSELALARTTFTLTLSHNERENLTDSNIDKTFISSLSARRKMSGRSNIALTWQFSHVDYNTNAIDTIATQSDYYRNILLSYQRTMAKTLDGDINLEYRNRSTQRNDRDYEELRVSLNLIKKF